MQQYIPHHSARITAKNVFVVAWIITLFAAIFSGCGKDSVKPNNVILFDFEDDSELDRFAWKCRSRFEISSDYSCTGKSSLRFEFHSTQRIGFSTGHVPRDWSIYKSFDFWVYNPSGNTVHLNLQVNRRETNGKFGHLIAKTFEIVPGPNKVSISLKAGSSLNGVPLTLEKVDGFYIFMQDTATVRVLYFDAFKFLVDLDI